MDRAVPGPQYLHVQWKPQVTIVTETYEIRSAAFTEMQGHVPSWHGKCTLQWDAPSSANGLSAHPGKLRYRFRGRIDPYRRQRNYGTYAPKESPESVRRIRPLRRRRCRRPFLELCARRTRDCPR